MSTEEKVLALIIERTQLDSKDTLSDMTFHDMGFDSLDMVELLMEVEDEFDIEIPDEQAELWKSPTDVTSYLKSRSL
jgi:acyl carrier protein